MLLHRYKSENVIACINVAMINILEMIVFGEVEEIFIKEISVNTNFFLMLF